MSHLNEFETEMDSQEALIRALVRMGFNKNRIEIHDQAVKINGYHQEDNFRGHIVIRKPHSGIPSDIGWEKKGGVYVSHLDGYNYTSWAQSSEYRYVSRHYDQRFNVQLLNYYNLEKSKMELEAKGIPYTETTDAKGRLMLRAKFKVSNSQSKIKVHSN